MNITAYDLAQRFVGMKEVAGTASNPAILAMLRLDDAWPQGDEVPWCSAFVNYICWLLRLPRSKSLAARSWLDVGMVVGGYQTFGLERIASIGFDVVIIARGDNPAPATVRDAPGHVGFYAGGGTEQVGILGGNQNNTVSIANFPISRILGIRRLA